MTRRQAHRVLAATAMVALFLLLSWGFLQLPAASSREAGVYDGNREDTNARNVVNSIITDYRAFDTLGEATVLFVSITAVATVLGRHER